MTAVNTSIIKCKDLCKERDKLKKALDHYVLKVKKLEINRDKKKAANPNCYETPNEAERVQRNIRKCETAKGNYSRIEKVCMTELSNLISKHEKILIQVVIALIHFYKNYYYGGSTSFNLCNGAINEEVIQGSQNATEEEKVEPIEHKNVEEKPSKQPKPSQTKKATPKKIEIPGEIEENNEEEKKEPPPIKEEHKLQIKMSAPHKKHIKTEEKIVANPPNNNDLLLDLTFEPIPSQPNPDIIMPAKEVAYNMTPPKQELIEPVPQIQNSQFVTNPNDMQQQLLMQQMMANMQKMMITNPQLLNPQMMGNQNMIPFIPPNQPLMQHKIEPIDPNDPYSHINTAPQMQYYSPNPVNNISKKPVSTSNPFKKQVQNASSQGSAKPQEAFNYLDL